MYRLISVVRLTLFDSGLNGTWNWDNAENVQNMCYVYSDVYQRLAIYSQQVFYGAQSHLRLETPFRR